ncbi:MAG: transcription antitermination factor NusB [Planctomycetota bacterium]
MSKAGAKRLSEASQGGSARQWAVQRLARVAEQFPHVEPPDNDLSGLSSADAALALAIYRTTVQRWFTLQHLLELYLPKQVRRLEPSMQAVLMSGAAQLVFFDRLPAYAVVGESVRLAHQFVRPDAKAMANAVLRKVDRLVSKAGRAANWTPDPCMIPLPGGRAIQCNDAVLPAVEPLDQHLVAAASVPLRLVREWSQRWGDDRVTELCVHAIQNPPTTIAVETGFAVDPDSLDYSTHSIEGLVTWIGPASELGGFLSQHADRRVQDAASTLAVQSTKDHQPGTILDYCAGQGTKTRQIALLHPGARVTATDTHPVRRGALREAVADLKNVSVIEPDQAGAQPYDLILLDVPCSNTGVLARRPEARYRYAQQSLGELVRLQREIIGQARGWLAEDGLLLYSTCSIEPPENQNQIKRLVKQGAQLLHEHQQMPQGTGDTYTDGSYHALVKI